MNIIYSSQVLLISLVYSAENRDVKVQCSSSVAFWMFVIPFSLQTLQGKICAFLNIFVVSVMVWVLHLMPEEMALKNVNLGSPFLRPVSALCHHFSLLLLF